MQKGQRCLVVWGILIGLAIAIPAWAADERLVRTAYFTLPEVIVLCVMGSLVPAAAGWTVERFSTSYVIKLLAELSAALLYGTAVYFIFYKY